MKKSYVKYLIPGAPAGGIISKVAVPTVALVGGYILVSKLTGFNPAGDALAGAVGAVGGGIQAIGNAIGTVSKPVGDAISSAGLAASNFVIAQIVQTGAIRFSKNPAMVGETIHVTMRGLQPFQDVRITWVEGGFDTGGIRADVSGNIDVLLTIPNVAPNTYQVNALVTYIAGDTRTFAANLVIVANNPDPDPEPEPDTFNNISLQVDPDAAPLGTTLTFEAQVYDLGQPLRQAGIPLGLYWQTNQVAQGLTDSNGMWVKSLSSSLFGRGDHRMFVAQRNPPAGQAPIADDVAFAVV